MGKQTNGMEDIAETLEDALGFSDENTDDNTSDENDSSESSKENEETKKDNDSFPGESNQKENNTNNSSQAEKEKDQKSNTKDTNTVTLTQEQVEINKEITKIDTELEKLEKDNTVDTNDFYDNLDDHLSEDEKQLEFDDKGAYLKLVDQKKEEYIKTHSNDEKISQLKEQREEYSKSFKIQEGIVAVTAKHPDFDFEKATEYFTRKLNEEQREEIFANASSYEDVYESVHQLMTGNKSKDVDSQPAPNIPNVNNTRKTTVTKDTIDDGLKTEEEELKEALGL